MKAQGGEWRTISSDIPVKALISGGMFRPGFTKELKVPATPPSSTLTAPTSVTRCSGGAWPVVSTSTTTKDNEEIFLSSNEASSLTRQRESGVKINLPSCPRMADITRWERHSLMQ